MGEVREPSAAGAQQYTECLSVRKGGPGPLPLPQMSMASHCVNGRHHVPQAGMQTQPGNSPGHWYAVLDASKGWCPCFPDVPDPRQCNPLCVLWHVAGQEAPLTYPGEFATKQEPPGPKAVGAPPSCHPLVFAGSLKKPCPPASSLQGCTLHTWLSAVRQARPVPCPARFLSKTGTFQATCVARKLGKRKRKNGSTKKISEIEIRKCNLKQQVNII